MKTLHIILAGATALGAALPAWAGPDWQTIERARKAKQAGQETRRGDVYEAMPPTGAGPVCPPRAAVLPLDHGPRAQTTPYLNQQRRERFEAELKACRDAAAKGVRQ